MRALSQTDFRQQLFRLLLCRLLAGAAYPQRAKHHVFQRREVREQIKLLENHPGFLTNQTFVHLRVVDLQTIDNQIAAGDLFQLIDAAQHR